MLDEEWLSELGFSLAENKFATLVGAELSKSFSIQFTGAPGIAKANRERCTRALRSRQRDGSVVWKHFQVQVPGSSASRKFTTLFLGPDKNPKQVKIEQQGKKLFRMLEDQFSHLQFHLQKSHGIISHNFVKIVKVEVGESRDAPTTLAWNSRAAEEIELDAMQVSRAFRGLPDKREQEAVQWTSV